MSLHPDIRFALSCFPAAQADGALSVLSDLGIASGKGKSGLTGDGLPFEVSFTTADDDLRWTCDLCSTATAPERLAQTRTAFARLGGMNAEPVTRPHRFGAWLGGRQTQNGQQSFKLYLDPGDDAPPPDAPLPRGDVAGFRPVLQMIGLGPDAARREYYYRFQSASPHLLRRLAMIAGLGHRAGDLLDILDDASARSPDDLLMRSSVGVSYAFASDGARPQLTVFLFARALWGSDAAIRSAFLHQMAAAGRDACAYAAATAPLRDYRRSCTWHGMAALTLTDTHHGWGIGLRPVQHPATSPHQRISPCPTPLPC